MLRRAPLDGETTLHIIYSTSPVCSIDEPAGAFNQE